VRIVWTELIVMLAAGALAWPGWRPVAEQHWPWIVYCGLTGALGQYLFTAAFRLAPASTIAPFEYTAMLWGIALDWLVFSTVPSVRVIVGGGIVIAGGLYIILDERRVAHVRVAGAPGG